MHAAAETALQVLLAVIAAALLLAYGWAASRKRRAGGWSAWRTASFAAGIALLLAAVSPAITEWAHVDLRGHMVQHLLIGMYAPLALALGAPVTLLLRVLPPRGGRSVVTLLATRPIRLLVHPVSAAMLDIGGMYLLYLTPLYALSLHNPLVHVLVHVHFLLSGYLFAWSIAGPDPAPQRPIFAVRLIVLFVAMAGHAILAKGMYAYGFPRGGSHGSAEIEAAAQWMYYGGDLAELLLAIALFGLLLRQRRRSGPSYPPVAAGAAPGAASPAFRGGSSFAELRGRLSRS